VPQLFVFLAGSYDLVDARAELSWTASTETELASYELRSTPGPDYAADNESTVASISPGGSLGYSTSAGFGLLVNAVSYKIYVRLTTGNESGNEPVTVNRPL